jgi:hypothetical protein
MKVDNGNTVWIAAFFPIEGMDIRHLEVARLICGKGCVKGRHFRVRSDNRMFIRITVLP